MNEEIKNKVIQLIREHVEPSKHIYRFSSYTIKSIFEELAACYISNVEFKELMAYAGFAPTPNSSNKENASYKIEIIPDEAISMDFWGRGGEAHLWESRKEKQPPKKTTKLMRFRTIRYRF